ncbi:MAG: DUF3794 domain-containing protein [Clostridiales bacterium]|nr:DUF3794 domain-containing protein [Clostridiales bacterium]
MEVKIVRENMEAAQVFAAKPMQAVVETEAALPGGLRDEARVYSADATVQTNGGELAGGRITVDGRVTFHVLYAQGNLAHVAALEATADFSQALSIREDGASAAGVRIAPRAAVEQVSAKAFNGRLLLRAVLSLSADAEALRPVSYVCDATGESCVEKDAGEIDVQRVVGEGEIQSLQKEEFELSDVLQIRETLYATGHAQVEDILGGADGRATVTGTIAIEAYHTADMPGRPLVYTRHTMPFEQTIGLSGASGDALAAQCDVRDVAVLSQDAGDGRKIMRAEVELHTVVSALENVKLPVLRDVYTTAGDMLDNTRQRVTYRTGMINEQTAESGRAVLMLPENSPRVKTALLALGRPQIVRAQRQGGKLAIDGVLVTTLIYAAEDSEIPVSTAQETPFRAVFATQAEPGDALSLTATQMEASMVTGDRVELKYILRLNAEGVRKGEIEVVTEAVPVAAQEPERGLTLYFLQPGERAWDVAKRFRISPQTLAAYNPQLEQKPDAPVMIYRR